MPTLSEHQSANAIKLLVVGDTGAGKTVALATLANAGFRLFIQDYDNGLDALRHFVKPEFHKQVFFKTFIDPLSDAQGRIAGIPSAATNGFKALDAWLEPLEADDPVPDGALNVTTPPALPGAKPGVALKRVANMGGVKQWGPQDVLVIDSLTFLGKACMNHVLALNGHLGQRPTMPDWGDAIAMQENMLAMLYSDTVKCNVVITAHLAFQDDTGLGGGQKGYPSALGSKLPPKVGRYFNSVVLVESQPQLGVGKDGRPNPPLRQLRTQSTPRIELKTPNPTIPPTLPIDPFSPTPSGLAAYINMVRGSSSSSS